MSKEDREKELNENKERAVNAMMGNPSVIGLIKHYGISEDCHEFLRNLMRAGYRSGFKDGYAFYDAKVLEMVTQIISE